MQFFKQIFYLLSLKLKVEHVHLLYTKEEQNLKKSEEEKQRNETFSLPSCEVVTPT